MADKFEDMRKERHWSEKKRSEMTERDWRIFREDFNIAYKVCTHLCALVQVVDGASMSLCSHPCHVQMSEASSHSGWLDMIQQEQVVQTHISSMMNAIHAPTQYVRAFRGFSP